MFDYATFGLSMVCFLVIISILGRLFLSPIYRGLRIISQGPRMKDLSSQESEIIKLAVSDVTSTQTPIGGILNMIMPSAVAGLKRKPQAVIGLLKLFPMMAGSIQAIQQMKQKSQEIKEQPKEDTNKGVY